MVVGVPDGEPLLAGRFDLLDGRLPTSPAEVALAPDVADDLDVKVGDRLSLTRPDLDLDVVGLVEDPSHLSDPVALVTPDAPLLGAESVNPPATILLIDLPENLSTAQLDRLSPAVELRTDSVLFDRGDRTSEVPWTYVIGGVVLTVAGIVISAAFAVGARRQLVTLGQLSANGAPGPVLRTTLVLQGTFAGVVGAVLGLALAAGFLVIGQGWFEDVLNKRFDAYDVNVLQIGGAMAVGVAAATVAALVPARTATRIPTLAALAGRRPLAPVRHRVTAAGALAVVVGLGLLGLAVLGSATGEDGQIWALVAVIGGVLELLGACAMAPAVVAHLEPLAGRTRGSWRVAARSLARQRSRTGAVVSAVAAAAGLAIGVTALVAGARDGSSEMVLSDQVVVATSGVTPASPVKPDRGSVEVSRVGESFPVPTIPSRGVQAELGQILPDADVVTMRTAGDQEDWLDLRQPVVADEAILAAFELGDDVRSALEDTGIVIIAEKRRVRIRAGHPGRRNRASGNDGRQ